MNYLRGNKPYLLVSNGAAEYINETTMNIKIITIILSWSSSPPHSSLKRKRKKKKEKKGNEKKMKLKDQDAVAPFIYGSP